MSDQPNVILNGGTGLWPDELRRRYLENVDAVFKLPMGNRYEHFAPSQQTAIVDGLELRVFVWVASTFVAE